jgi:hypothetical protein
MRTKGSYQGEDFCGRRNGFSMNPIIEPVNIPVELTGGAGAPGDGEARGGFIGKQERHL